MAPGASLDHGLAYEAIKAGQVNLIDIDSTDARVGRYALLVPVGDRNFFPRYDAVLLMRQAVDDKPLQRLAGRIDDAHHDLTQRAGGVGWPEFCAGGAGLCGVDGHIRCRLSGASAPGTSAVLRAGFWQRLFAPDLWRLTGQHLVLVFGSVLLALLVFLIALLGSVGFWPALMALVDYALLAGVKTAPEINVGTATVAASVGAGGLGERNVAGLAVVVQWGFDVPERRLGPPAAT